MSQEKITVLTLLFLTVCSVALATDSLTMTDDGYAWQKANYEAKVNICQNLASIGKHDWNFYYGAFNSFYDSSDSNVLSMSISRMYGLFEVSDTN
ncbi:MAG: hypothetical protein ABH891_07130 [Candidatus Omnitrophota bacterium]